MQEAIHGYLMCIEARERIFVRCTINTKIYNFTLPRRLIFLAHKSLWLILNVQWPFDRLEFILILFLRFLLIFRHTFVSTSERMLNAFYSEIETRNCMFSSLAWSAWSLLQIFSLLWHQNWKWAAHFENGLHGQILAWVHHKKSDHHQQLIIFPNQKSKQLPMIVS